MLRTRWIVGVILVCLVAICGLIRTTAMAGNKPGAAPSKESSGAKPTNAAARVFELRTYHTNEGKLDDLHARFREHTCELLRKHGAELIGFWTPLDEKDGKGGKLVYMLAFPSREEAKKTWADFGEDPEWRRVYEESHKNGVLVKNVESVFLEPTDYSALK
jgi:hypothetical protein